MLFGDVGQLFWSGETTISQQLVWNVVPCNKIHVPGTTRRVFHGHGYALAIEVTWWCTHSLMALADRASDVAEVAGERRSAR